MKKRSKKIKPYIIAIAGGTGSGKSLLAEKLASASPKQALILEQDAYYKNLKRGQKERPNFDQPDSLDNKLLVSHLKRLIAGKSIRVPVYNFKTHKRSKRTKKALPKPIIIVNGIFVFVNPTLRKLFDFKIYIDVPADIRFGYRLLRDIKERGYTPRSSFEYYKKVVHPMNEKYIEPSKKFADIVITNYEGDFIVATDVLLPKVKEELGKRI